MSTTANRNRLGNASNPYQGTAKRVLCVCSAGLLRSPTAAWLLSNDPWNFNTRSVGYDTEFALVVLDPVHLHWCDEVVVFDSRQEEAVRSMMHVNSSKPVHNLNVPDDFDFRSPELVQLLTEKFQELYSV